MYGIVIEYGGNDGWKKRVREREEWKGNVMNFNSWLDVLAPVDTLDRLVDLILSAFM